MSDGANIGNAYVQIIPSMQGAQQTITKELEPAGTAAGKSAGGKTGKSMCKALGDKFSSLGSTLTKSVTLPIVAAGGAAVAAWKQIDNGADTIATKTGATGEALAEMKDSMNNIATSIPVSFDTAGAAIGEVNTRFGLTGEALEELSTKFVKFADINGQDVSSAVDSTSKVLAAFGKNTDDAGEMLDALNVVGQKTGVDVGTLADQLATNAVSFKQMGLSAEDAAAFLGQVDMAGIDSSQAIMGLRTAMKNAAKDGGTLSEALSGFEKTMDSNKSETEKLQAAYELFGSRAGASIYNAVSEGTLNLQDFDGALGEFAGSVDSTFEETQQPIEKLQTALNEIMIAGADLVEAAAPAIEGFVETIVPAIEDLTSKWEGLDEGTQQFILKIGGIAAVAGPVISIVGKLGTGIGGIVNFTGKAASGLGGLAGKISGIGSAAVSATPAVGGAATSFGAMAGQALQLVALGAAVMLVGMGMKIMADAAIQLTAAGTGAVATFVLIAGVGVGMAAALALIGSVATVSAVGLLALGAAVALVGAGIWLATNGVAALAEQLPTISTYGGSSALAMLQISGAALVLSGASLLLAGSLGICAVAFVGFSGALGLASLALIAYEATSLIALATTLLLEVALAGVAESVAGIKNDAKAAADALTGMASSVDTVQAVLDGLGQLAENAVNAVISAFSGGESKAKAKSDGLGKAINSGIKSGIDSAVKSFNAGMMMINASAVSQLTSLKALFRNTSFEFSHDIKLPHFKMTGKFDAKNNTVPSIDVNWYKKGGIFTSPSIIGVGEAGAEAVVPLDKGGLSDTYINMTVNGAESPEMWAKKFARELKRQNRMRG